MKLKTLLSLCIMGCVVWSFTIIPYIGLSQETAPSEPATEEAKKEEAESSGMPQFGEQQVWAELGKIFGKKFSLTTDEDKGRLSYEIGDNEGLKFFRAKEKVHVKSDMFEIKCQALEYLGEKKVIVATGDPVWLQQGGIKATCGRFEYDTIGKRTELSEKPEIYSRDKAGKMVKTVGKKIYIEQDEKGNASVMVEGNARIEYVEDDPKVNDLTADDGAAKEAIPLDDTNVNQIK